MSAEHEGRYVPEEERGQAPVSRREVLKFLGLAAGSVAAEAGLASVSAGARPSGTDRARVEQIKIPAREAKELAPILEAGLKKQIEGLVKNYLNQATIRPESVLRSEDKVLEVLSPGLLSAITAIKPVLEKKHRSAQERFKGLREGYKNFLAGGLIGGGIVPEIARKVTGQEPSVTDRQISATAFGAMGAGAEMMAKGRETEDSEDDEDLEKEVRRAGLALIDHYQLEGLKPLGGRAFHENVSWSKIMDVWARTDRLLADKFKLATHLERYAAVFYLLDRQYQARQKE